MLCLKEGFNRCYDPGTLTALAIGAAVAGAGSSIYGGVSANKSAKQEAGLQEEQGRIALDEARMNAENEAKDQTTFVQRQRLAFLANGVSTEGSPSVVLEESRRYGQSQVDAILRQGQSQYNLAQRSATITRNKGRAALISGVISGAGQLASAGAAAGQAGMFDPKTTFSAGSFKPAGYV